MPSVLIERSDNVLNLLVDVIIGMLLQLQQFTRKSKMFKFHENRLIVVIVNINLLIVQLILMLFFSVKEGINRWQRTLDEFDIFIAEAIHKNLQ